MSDATALCAEPIGMSGHLKPLGMSGHLVESEGGVDPNRQHRVVSCDDSRLVCGTAAQGGASVRCAAGASGWTGTGGPATPHSERRRLQGSWYVPSLFTA